MIDITKKEKACKGEGGCKGEKESCKELEDDSKGFSTIDKSHTSTVNVLGERSSKL
jgi:hypothetical protein